jgi:SAM-dependent methyltransferase
MTISQIPRNACAICNENNPESFRIWFDGHLRLYKCSACGFISAFPSPGKSTFIYDYSDLYNLDFLKQGMEFMYPERENCFRDILNRIISRKATGEILDIGCGDGQFIYLCNSKGFRCSGVEESKILSSYASERTGAKIISGKYKKDMFPAESFDVITLIQVLEHIPLPKETLEAVYYHLRKNGLIVIEIPSINAPHFLAYRFTGIKKFVQNDNGVINSHVGYYCPDTLLNLTKISGFDKVSLVTGRWQYKYNGFLNRIGKMIDPVMNMLNVGGILYFGKKI